MDHGYMPIVVEVLENDEYQDWLESQKSDAAKIAAAE
jgi:heme/copper-type cytochrome/quinol oxidase subunit 2